MENPQQLYLRISNFLKPISVDGIQKLGWARKFKNIRAVMKCMVVSKYVIKTRMTAKRFQFVKYIKLFVNESYITVGLIRFRNLAVRCNALLIQRAVRMDGRMDG